ncbi:hypothetical protein SAMN06273572_1193 [Monaibacterium marinum]|uniref:Phage integrase family protein n=1 Tax=Pontivivens marinum TaxID=1690039 RepID=A0A2C9CWX6_9RHOB|nr:site-specific integrase [Monaibacterium marinum]SOH95703.1 hypothetical protein SAMN06273572_1193 [Monaibacterium marinum]
MSSIDSMKTMADVVQRIEKETPFSEAFQRKVLGSVRRMRRLPQYNVPLEQIPADLNLFDRVWGRGAIRSIPMGFKSKSSYATWRSQVRSALFAVVDSTIVKSKQGSDDEWSQLISDFEANTTLGKKVISISVLAEVARKDGVAPADVSEDWLQCVVDAADTTGRYRSVQAAAQLIHKHGDLSSVAVSSDFDGTSIRKSQRKCVRAQLPEPLATEVREWEQERVRGERVGHRRKRMRGCSQARAKQALSGITYVYRALLECGHIKPEERCSISLLKNADWLEDVIERELEGEFPWEQLKRTTLFEYVNNWKLLVKGCGHDPLPLTDVIRDFADFQNVKSMSDDRRQWCEIFLNDPTKQAILLGLPNRLFKDAKKAMLGYEDGSSHHRNAAIALGIAAGAAAIWTSLPLRISTLTRLSYGGPEADVQLHDARKGLILTTPPDIVKNGYSHSRIHLSPKRGGSPHEIISWYVQNVRPHLLEGHIQSRLRQPNLLFAGVSSSRLGSIWREVTLDAGIPMTPHQIRHALATLLANEQNADYANIAALLGDTEMTVRKNYVFVDRAKKHVDGQNALARIQGNILMRGGV